MINYSTEKKEFTLGGLFYEYSSSDTIKDL
jgi:hypothetical protein